jgi:TPP-dependent pyruvate/acetoin dehydrogenase alpha subunit
VVEYNRFAQSTATDKSHAGELKTRAKSFDIPLHTTAGDDCESVAEEAAKAVERVKSNQTPVVLFISTYRLAPHSTGPDLRSESEIAEYSHLDPLNPIPKLKGDRSIEAFEEQIEQVISKAVESAENASTGNLSDYLHRLKSEGILGE